MKIVDLGTSIKWQKTDKREVPDVRNKVINEIKFLPGLILEIGCAAGNFFGFLPEYARNEYIGIDLNLNQINKAKERYSTDKFICGNIFDFENTIKSAKTIVSFQVIEHIENDFDLFDKFGARTKIIFSVPNFGYRDNFPDGHKRYYELDGWIKRYENILNISEAWIIKHYKKNRKIFVFQCTRR